MAIELGMRTMLLSVVMIVVACCASDAPDWHVSSNGPAHALFFKSAFVHGYMHGYEQGFHAADLDLNFGRSPRNPEKMDEYREPIGYKRQFGDWHVFENGYREGFRVGYSDGINQRAFRAVDQARSAAAGLPDNGGAKPSKTFDEGFSVGYRAGSGVGLHDARSGAQFRNAPGSCGARYVGAYGPGEFCTGYTRGYQFGYADGYVTQGSPPEQRPGNLQQLPASVFLRPGTEPPRK